jgi:dCMP deaminase
MLFPNQPPFTFTSRKPKMARTVEISAHNHSEPTNTRIDPALVKSTGNAEPTGRLLNGSEDHSCAEEWAEPAVLPSGEKVSRMYLFEAEDITADNGEPLPAEDYPWDNAHVARIKTHDTFEQQALNWDQYLMGFAKHAALKSKDATKVGAAAVGTHNQILEVGFNGPPRGVQDLPERRERPAKYLFSAHAEANLVATAARERLQGSTVYITHLCCSSCAKSLIQAGVTRIVVGEGLTSMPKEEFEAAKTMLAEAGVDTVYFPDK